MTTQHGIKLSPLENDAERIILELNSIHPPCHQKTLSWIVWRAWNGWLHWIKKCIQKHEFDTSKLDLFCFVHGAVSGLLDDQSSTMQDYLVNTKSLVKFAIEIGDYRTATLCDCEFYPANSHLANSMTFLICCYWKTIKPQMFWNIQK